MRWRTGRRMNIAANATAKFISADTRNTVCQPPVWVFSTLASGTSQAEVPFAVYSSIAFVVANAVPNRSVQVEGNRLKISPQVKKISAAQITKAQGLWPA